MENFNITNYNVTLSKATLTYNGKNYTRLAIINSYGPNQSTDIVKFCNISFIADAEVLPPNVIPSNTTAMVGTQYIISIYYPASCYAWFLDLLRNEKPIFVQYYTESDKSHKNSIRTGSEPIGEAE